MTAIGVFGLALLWAARLPVLQKALADLPIMRFGFAGPTRYVSLMQIEATPGLREPMTAIGPVRTRAGRRGGGGGMPAAAKASDPQEERPRGPRMTGVGDEAHDLVRRALNNQGDVPIFQSEELIIVKLVRPEYPEDARARGIEGKVAVLALVDTAGRVSDAEVMTASGEPMLDQAAEVAVRQCTFQPFVQDGEVREVYAVFRFAFRIY